MSAVYPENLVLSVYLSSAWVDITQYHIAPIDENDGLGDTQFTNRMASAGSMSFVLNNQDGLFTVGGDDVLTGWQKGVTIKLDQVYDNETVNIFYGRILDIHGSSRLPHFLDIECEDWMAATSKFPVQNQGLMTNVTIDEAIRTVVNALPWQPANRNFELGANVFPTVFDDIGKKGRPAGEINKLLLSELGFMYLRRNETLVLETMGSRARLTPVLLSSEAPLADAFSDTGIWEDSDTIQFEDGDLLLWNQTQAATFENAADTIPMATEFCDAVIWEDSDAGQWEGGELMYWNDVEEAAFEVEYNDLDVETGPNHFNRVTIKAYPRFTDTSDVRLYRLGTPLKLPAGKQVRLEGHWTNPTSGTEIGATSVDDPLAQTTNYTANAKKNGSGTDLTSQLVIDEWNIYANSFVALITSPAGGWLTKFEINGLGIYLNDQAETDRENSDSITNWGETSISVDQRYLDDFAFSETLIAAELLFQRDPRLEGVRLHLLANKSAKMMMAFLYLGIGNLIRITNSQHNLDNFFYIYNREYSIEPRGIINYSWGLKQVPAQSDMTEVELECDISSSVVQDAIGLGVLGSWATRKITFFCEVFVTSVGTSVTVMGLPFLAGGDSTFLRMQVNSAGQILIRTTQFDGTAGAWTTNGTVATGRWVAAAVSYDSESLLNAPEVYIDGAVTTFSSSTAPTGSRVDEPITYLELGGHLKEQTSASYDLRVRRHRWFNGGLTAAEHLELAQTPTDFSLFRDRLLMGGLGVPTRYYSDFLDAPLDENVKVVDMVASAVSVAVSGAPTVRALT